METIKEYATTRNLALAGAAIVAISAPIAIYRKTKDHVVAAVEAGGTSFSVALAKESDVTQIIDRVNFPTTSPAETISQVVAWLKVRKFDSLAVASFGPVDLDEDSPHYGSITTTPKPNWAHTAILRGLEEFKVPKAFDTDVNAPAMSEAVLGGHSSQRKITTCVYITVGTGIGVGVVVGNTPVHGLVHPEGGHVLVPRMAGDEAFQSTCPFHANCVEGLIATGALARRIGKPASELPSTPDTDPLWETIGFYLAALCANLVLTVSPSVIVLGGGVMNRDILYPIVRRKLLELLNSYIKSPLLTPENVNKYIVRSKFGADSGLIGALYLSKLALHKNKGFF